MTNDNEEPSAASVGSLAWIPVTERLPGNFTPVLATTGNRVMVAACSKMKEFDTPLWVTIPASGFVHPTHWMPLPEPPEVTP